MLTGPCLEGKVQNSKGVAEESVADEVGKGPAHQREILQVFTVNPVSAIPHGRKRGIRASMQRRATLKPTLGFFWPRGCKQTLNTTTAHMGDVLNIREPRYLRVLSSRSCYFGVGVGARLTHLALRLPGDTLKYPEEPILPLTSSKYDLRPYTGFLMRSCYDPRQLGSLGPETKAFPSKPQHPALCP